MRRLEELIDDGRSAGSPESPALRQQFGYMVTLDVGHQRPAGR